ncbi:MAG TPA: hypothetical protein VK858_21300, partial [Longimicrobiales bacterium]|nr:hypothetical protein [Longimicrobiales bacterium]
MPALRTACANPSSASARVALAAVLLLLATPPAVPLAAQSPAEVARSFREANEAVILRDFAELLSYPNVASDREGIRRTAEYIVGELEAAGVDAELLEVGDAPPIVYGELR